MPRGATYSLPPLLDGLSYRMAGLAPMLLKSTAPACAAASRRAAPAAAETATRKGFIDNPVIKNKTGQAVGLSRSLTWQTAPGRSVHYQFKVEAAGAAAACSAMAWRRCW